MSTNATLAATEQTDAPISTSHTHLAPPFGPPWMKYVSPDPIGYWCSVQLDSGTGAGVIRLGADPHPPTAALAIGWCWGGWKRRISVQIQTAFTVVVRCDRVIFNGEGTFVPRCFLTLRPVAGGPDILNSVVLYRGQTSYVTVVAPWSPVLPAPYDYELQVAFNVRASYSGAKNPQGEVRATIQSVVSYYAFPIAAEGASELDAATPASGSETENGVLDRHELARALADLERNAKQFEIESERAALAAGLETLVG